MLPELFTFPFLLRTSVSSVLLGVCVHTHIYVYLKVTAGRSQARSYKTEPALADERSQNGRPRGAGSGRALCGDGRHTRSPSTQNEAMWAQN